METIIQCIILLLLFILLVDRFYTKKTTEKANKKITINKKETSIMGKSKMVSNNVEVNVVSNSQQSIVDDVKSKKVVPNEALDAIFDTSKTHIKDLEDWELVDEEEDLKTNFSETVHQDFNTGISVEELGEIPTLLQQDSLTSETLPVAVKIADTELLEILNEQIPQAQQKISELLDKHLTAHQKPMITEDWRDFDIEKFI